MIGGLILAAGAGSRFGAAQAAAAGPAGPPPIKQLVPFRGKPLLQWAVDAQCAVREIERVVLVLGAHHEAILAALDLHRAQAAICPNWPDGLSASLKLGMRTLADCDRVIVTLGDQPLIDAATVRLFLDAPAGTRGTHAGRPGHPVVLGPEHRARLDSLTGDRGAAPLLNDAHLIELGPASTLDIDRPQDIPAD